MYVAVNLKIYLVATISAYTYITPYHQYIVTPGGPGPSVNIGKFQ